MEQNMLKYQSTDTFIHYTVHAGIIMAGNEISEISLATILAYYGGKGHRPRWVAFGIMCIVCSSFIMSSPNFILGSGVANLKFNAQGSGKLSTIYNRSIVIIFAVYLLHDWKTNICIEQTY
jgi:hypothetical protein